eukprot:GILI01011850.1.p1 GENE.GILI01011850.1~~GILI01011850.1.p1  ORF type:complete len:334 (-),score=42.20 GILI01011850.1:49-1050(-)
MSSDSVRRTAFEASSRKVHAVSKGYLNDKFVHYFQSDHTLINSPLMNRGYWLRAKAFENSLVNFANMFPPETEIQVINLGCGFDTLFFRWADNPSLDATVPNVNGPLNIVKFLDLDVWEMIDSKRRIIAKNTELKAIADQYKEVYFPTTCDLSSPAELGKALQAANINPSKPTFILAECVLVYIAAAESNALLQYITQTAFPRNENVLLTSYDMIGPDDRFGKMMIENLTKMGLSIKSIDALKTVKDHEERCLKVGGFAKCKGLTMKALYMTVSRESQLQLNKLEIIDDWDEWGLVHEHYCFVLASTNSSPTFEIPLPFPRPTSVPLFGTFEK